MNIRACVIPNEEHLRPAYCGASGGRERHAGDQPHAGIGGRQAAHHVCGVHCVAILSLRPFSVCHFFCGGFPEFHHFVGFGSPGLFFILFFVGKPNVVRKFLTEPQCLPEHGAPDLVVLSSISICAGASGWEEEGRMSHALRYMRLL